MNHERHEKGSNSTRLNLQITPKCTDFDLTEFSYIRNGDR